MNKNQKFMLHVLEGLEKLSTCSRVQVGAVIERDGRIITTGYNGVPSGHTHCVDLFDNPDTENHRIFSQENELHAEQNAIAYAARDGRRLENSKLYISVSPCIMCAKLIVSCGIDTVYFKKIYDRSSLGLEFLKKSKVKYYLLHDKKTN